MTKMKEIPINDRPIERLINNGCECLSNEELLAILLKTGNKNESAKIVASNILSNLSNISDLKKIRFEELLKIKGIGKVKAATLLATIELSKRINQRLENINGIKIKNSSIIYEYYKNILETKTQEYFYCIYLDSQKRIIKDKILFIGTLNYSLVHPREIFKEAYLVSAASIICLHNHPSGDINPSKDDIILTKELSEVGNLFGIPIIDHIIIAKDNYYSFFENNNIK